MKKILTLFLISAFMLPVFAQRDYTKLHDMLIKFYGYQRAGLKSGSANNLNSGFTNASHNGDAYNSNPLDGGWYDAGDYIKFGMPLGYTVYCLLKGYDIFPNVYSDNSSWDYKSKDGIPDILNEVKVATDYLIKAVINESTIIRDVGKAEGTGEHGGLGDAIPGNLADGRTNSEGFVFTCDGADIPAMYAAGLALMSILYREFDEDYAETCLQKAKISFSFAKSKFESNKPYCSFQKKNGDTLYYYKEKSESINDKMVAAGVELYRATNDGDPSYKEYAKKPIGESFNCMGYAFVGPLSGFEAWRQGLSNSSAISLNAGFMNKRVKTDGIFKDIYQNSGWGTAREAGSAAFGFALAYITTPEGTGRDLYLKRVKDHVDWVTGYKGSPSRSYVIGFNNSPATQIHYRSPSTPLGGLVSGPNGDGNWENSRESAEFCEVAIDYNAGIAGAVAFLKALENPDGVKVSKAFSVSSNEVDFSKGAVTLTATFSESVEYTINITGAFGKKTIKKTGTSINESWNGSADEGFFLSGETVNISVSINKDIFICDLININGAQIYIKNALPSEAKSSDVKLDDFEDEDTINATKGNWIPFGTGTTYTEKSKVSFSTENGSKALKIYTNVKTSGNDTYGGAKATFKADNSSCSIKNAKSILFSMRATKDTYINVELEQSNITDNAFYNIRVPVLKTTNTYRLNFSDFKQHDWKKSSVDLDLSKILSVRFTVYGADSILSLFIDNVSIEDLSIVSALNQKVNNVSAFKPVFTNEAIHFQIPQQLNQPVELSVFNVAGKMVMKEKLFPGPASQSISLSKLPAGIYTLIHNANGKDAVYNNTKFTLFR